MPGSEPGAPAQAITGPDGTVTFVNPATSPAFANLPPGSPGALLLQGPQAPPPAPVAVRQVITLPPAPGRPGRLVRLPGGAMAVTPSGLMAVPAGHPAVPVPSFDPPMGSAVIQGLPDGSVSVAPLPAAYNGDDAQTINAAALQLQLSAPAGTNGAQGGRVRLHPRPYNLKSTIVLGASTILEGAGSQTVLNQNFTGTGIFQHDTVNTGGLPFGASQLTAGGVRDLVLDGSGAGAGSIGYDVGDAQCFRVDIPQIQNYAATSAVGMHLSNLVTFTEKSFFRCRFVNCTTAVVLDNVSGSGQNSFEFNDFDFCVLAMNTGSGQNGVVLQSGSYMRHCKLRIIGNFSNSPRTMTNYVLTIQGSDASSGFISHITDSQVLIQVETDQSQVNNPNTVLFGTPSGGSANSITQCTGLMAFTGTFNPSNATAASFNTFGGMIFGDTVLQGLNTAPPGWP